MCDLRDVWYYFQRTSKSHNCVLGDLGSSNVVCRFTHVWGRRHQNVHLKMRLFFLGKKIEYFLFETFIVHWTRCSPPNAGGSCVWWRALYHMAQSFHTLNVPRALSWALLHIRPLFKKNPFYNQPERGTSTGLGVMLSCDGVWSGLVFFLSRSFLWIICLYLCHWICAAWSLLQFEVNFEGSVTCVLGVLGG